MFSYVFPMFSNVFPMFFPIYSINNGGVLASSPTKVDMKLSGVGLGRGESPGALDEPGKRARARRWEYREMVVYWLVVWNIFPHILGIITPTD